MSKFNRLLLVIKQTAFASYTAREELAQAAGRTLRFDHARMARLRERHDTHMFQVERITELLEQRGAATTSVMRDDVTPEQVADARQEELLTRMAAHPNIIRLEDAIITDGCLYLVLEHLRGGELFDYVVARGTLSEAEASGILRDLASAVRYMHAKGIIHRDLKPENLLLDEAGYLKVVDFGFAKVVEDRTFTVCGTPEYLAPEL